MVGSGRKRVFLLYPNRGWAGNVCAKKFSATCSYSLTHGLKVLGQSGHCDRDVVQPLDHDCLSLPRARLYSRPGQPGRHTPRSAGAG